MFPGTEEDRHNFPVGKGLKETVQSEVPRPIPRNSVESDHRCTFNIFFDNRGDNMTLTLNNVTLTS